MRRHSLLLISIGCFLIYFILNKQLGRYFSIQKLAHTAQEYIQEAEADFEKSIADKNLISHLVKKSADPPLLKKILKKNYGFFLYESINYSNKNLLFWNTQQMLPPVKKYYGKDSAAQLEHLVNGYYYIIKKTLKSSSGFVEAYAAIPIASEYFIATDYLPSEFVFKKGAYQYVSISEAATDFPVANIEGRNIFYLQKRLVGMMPQSSFFTVFFELIGILFLLLCIQAYTDTLVVINKKRAICFLASVLLVLRIVTYLFPSLFHLRQFNIFDPAIYGSSIILQSLGDLLINVGIVAWIVFYTRQKLQHNSAWYETLSGRYQALIGIVALIGFIFTTFIFSSIIRSIIADSKISFDVTRFYSLNKNTVIGFVALSAITLTYYYFSQILFKIIFNFFRKNIWLVYFAIGASGLLYLTFLQNTDLVNFYLWVLLWLLAYTWFVHRAGFTHNLLQLKITDALTWMVIFSISIAAVMVVENKNTEWKKRKYYAEKLALHTDPSSERLLSIAIKYVDNELLQKNFSRFADREQNKKFKDSIFQNNYSGYLTQYETKFYAFDENDHPLFNGDNVSHNTIRTIIKNQSKVTAIPDLYYFESGLDTYNYITQREVKDSTGRYLGAFYIISIPKRFKSDALFPEIFQQFKNNDLENSTVYTYAIYKNTRLIASSEKYPFETILTRLPFKNSVEIARVQNDNYDELWYRAGSDKVVVIARKLNSFLEGITLFSYLFCALLLLHFLAQLCKLFANALNDKNEIRRFFQFNIRRQVHSTIIFASIFSFIIIGFATISFIKERYQKNNKEMLSRTMRIVLKKMEPEITATPVGGRSAETIAATALYSQVRDIAGMYGVDINVYNLDGHLLVSSEEHVYTKGVLSRQMDPAAFYNISRLHKIEHWQTEKIANFSYMSIYAPLRDRNGREIAFVSIPYFTSEPELNDEISNFTVTVINLNAFIFLIAGLIALFITNRITRSFSFISNKMKEVNIGAVNEKIVWARKDEIGELVTEYNTMVDKLGESVKTLARTEREGAWREMAKQVAHEIKNPLTPMKLSIQYLQKAINNNHPDIKTLTTNVAGTLVEQINHLAKIASDFSQFANISILHFEEFHLSSIIKPIYDLYRSDVDVKISWQQADEQIKIRADKTQMNRLFTNLLSNAREAHKAPPYHIHISEKPQEDSVVISIEDSGTGIAQEARGKIFFPNFTTKSSGTGLGLAMCKGIVERINGEIWFETYEGVGTVFYVEIPIVV